MSELPQPGLRASEPIGFLAALGLLRVVTGRGTFGAAKLSWSDDSAWSAVLHTEHDCDPDRLLDDLLTHMRGRAAAPMYAGRSPDGTLVGDAEWNDIKVDPCLFRDWLVLTRQDTTAGRREGADFLSALGSELVTARSTPDLKPSALHMTSAQQQLLKACRTTATPLDPQARLKRGAKTARATFHEVLFGPWRYEDDISSLGLDPNTEANHALLAAAPSDQKLLSTRGAVWLAIEAIPLFRAVPVGGRLQTSSFRVIDSQTAAFRWAVWDGGLGLNAVRTLLGSQDVVQVRPDARQLRSLGIRAVMESMRITKNQGYGQLRPAVRVGEGAGSA